MVRVHGWVSEEQVQLRFHHIREFERMLADEGTTIAKFYLHISKDEQLKRFQSRQVTPHKRWKITDEDWRNREKWDDYYRAVSDMLHHTSTRWAPWTIVEGNDKPYARIRTLRVLTEALAQRLNTGSELASD